MSSMAHATRPIDMMNVKRCLAEKPPTTTNQKQSKNLLDVGAALEEGGANIEDHLCVVVDAEVVGVHQLEKHRRREAVAGEHDGHGLAALERRAVRDERALDAAQDVTQRVGEEGLGTAEVDADRAFRADGNAGSLQLADRLPHIRLRVN